MSNTEKISQNLQHKTVDEIRDEAHGSLTAKQAVSKALAAKTVAPEAGPKTAKAPLEAAPEATVQRKVKINRTPKAKLSVIPESVQAQAAPAEIYALSEPPQPVVKKLKS